MEKEVTGIKSFMQKVAEKAGKEFNNEKADEFIKKYNNDYGKIVDDIGTSYGVKPERLSEFREKAFKQYSITPYEDTTKVAPIATEQDTVQPLERPPKVIAPEEDQASDGKFSFGSLIPNKQPPSDTEQLAGKEQAKQLKFSNEPLEGIELEPLAGIKGFGRGTIVGSVGAARSAGLALKDQSLKLNTILKKVSDNPGWQSYLKKQDERLVGNIKNIKKWGEKLPELKGGAGEFVGGMVPFVSMAIATALTRSPALAMATTGFFGEMGYGEAGESYDNFQDEKTAFIKQINESENGSVNYEQIENAKNLGYTVKETDTGYQVYNEDGPITESQPDEAARLGAQFLYSMVYTLPVGHVMGKMAGKVIPKALAKSIASNPELAGKAGKEMFEAFAKQSPKGAKQFLNSLKDGVLTMESLGLGKLAVDDVVVGKDVSLGEYLKTGIHAAGSGMVFSFMTAPFAIPARIRANKQRWKNQKEVTVTMDKDGNAVEILPVGKDGVQKGMTPDGKIVEVTSQMVEKSHTMTSDMFLEALDGYAETGKMSESFDRDSYIGRVKQYADNVSYAGGESILIIKDIDGNTLFLKEGDFKTALQSELHDTVFMRNDGKDWVVMDQKGNEFTVPTVDTRGVEITRKQEFIDTYMDKYDNQGKPKLTEGEQRLIPVEKRITELQDNDGNVSRVVIDGKEWYIRNPKDIGDGITPIMAKDGEGNVKAFPNIQVKDYNIETKSPEEIKNEAISMFKAEDAAILQAEQIQKQATEKGIEVNRTVETPNGKGTVASINPDNTITIAYAKGEKMNFHIDEVEQYKTQEQKDAEKEQIKLEEEAAAKLLEGIEEGGEVTSDESIQLDDENDIRVVDFSNGQSKIITPEGEQILNSKEERDNALNAIIQPEGFTPTETAPEINIDELSPEERFAESSKDDPEIAKEMLSEDIAEIRAQADELRKIEATKTERRNNLKEAKKLETEAIRLEGILNGETQKLVNAAEALAVELQEEAANAPANQLLGWQQEALGEIFSTDQFVDIKDKNELTPPLRKAWLKKDGTPIDTWVAAWNLGIEEGQYGGDIITTEDVVDFIIDNPTKNIRSTTGRMNEIKAEYQALTGKSINNHETIVKESGLTPDKSIPKTDDPRALAYEEGIAKLKEAGFSDEQIAKMNEVDETPEEKTGGMTKDPLLEAPADDVPFRVAPGQDLKTLETQLAAAKRAYNNAINKWRNLNNKLKNSPEFGNRGQADIFGNVAGSNTLDFGGGLSDARKAVSNAKKIADQATEEINSINRAIKNVKDKSGNQGTLFRAKETKGGITMSTRAAEDLKNKQNAVKAIKKMQDDYGIEVTILHSSDMPANIREQARKMRIIPAGYYDNPTAVIISDAITSVSDTKKTYLHEAIYHKGLDVLFVKGTAKILGKEYKNKLLKKAGEVHNGKVLEKDLMHTGKDQFLEEVFSRLDNQLIGDRTREYGKDLFNTIFEIKDGKYLLKEDTSFSDLEKEQQDDLLKESMDKLKNSEEYKALNLEQKKTAQKDVKESVKNKKGYDLLTNKQKLEIAEEVLATINEMETIPSRLEVLVDSLWKYIKKAVGFSSKQFTKTDLLNMLAKHREMVKNISAEDKKLTETGNIVSQKETKVPETGQEVIDSQKEPVSKSEKSSQKEQLVADGASKFREVRKSNKDIIPLLNEVQNKTKPYPVKGDISGWKLSDTGRQYIHSNGTKWDIPQKSIKGDTYDYLQQLIKNHNVKKFDPNVFDYWYNKSRNDAQGLYSIYGKRTTAKGDNPTIIALRIYDHLRSINGGEQKAKFRAVSVPNDKNLIVSSEENIGTFDPENADIRFKVAEARAETEVNPSEAQKEAGNYKMGHVKIDGFDISIENPKGSTRSGTDNDGKQWSREMPTDYGYFKGTIGKDKDHIDVFIGDNPESDKIYVIDQVNPKTGSFDEHKVMLGFDNVSTARNTYNSAYEDGWKGLGNITRTDKAGLKGWFKGDTKKPYSGVKFRAITDTKEFKEWFGESKMVDSKGNPMIVYHGTGNDFDVFQYGHGGVNKKPEEAFYFSNSADVAGKYSSLPSAMKEYSHVYKRENHHPSVMPVYLKADKIKVIDVKGGKWIGSGIRAKVKNAKSKGFDGVIIKNINDVVEGETQYVVFYSTQIKSATANTGAFDAKNPNIRFKVSSSNPELQKKLDYIYALQEASEIAARVTELKKAADSKYTPEEFRQTIKGKLATLREGKRLGAKEKKEQIRKIQDIVTAYANKHVPMGEAGKRSLKTLQNMIKKSTTPQSIEKAFNDIDNLAGKVVAKGIRTKNTNHIKRLMDWMGNTDNFVYANNTEFKQFRETDKETIKQQKILNSLNTTEAEKEAADNALDRMWNELDAKVENRTMLEDVQMKLIEYRRNKTGSSDELIASIREDLQIIYDAAKDAKKGEDIQKAIDRKSDREFVKALISKTPMDEESWNKQKRMSINNWTINSMGNWETLLIQLGGQKLRDKFTFILNQANKEVSQQATFDKVLDQVREGYGFKTKNEMLRHLQVLKEKNYSMVKPNREGARGEGQDLKLSKMDIMDLYNAIKNENLMYDTYMTYGDISLAEDGSRDADAQYKSGEARITELLTNLEDADRAFADIMQVSAQEYYPKYNNVFVKFNNRDLGMVDNYWPSSAEYTSEEGIFDQFRMDSLIPSAAKGRAAHRTVEITDAFDKYVKHIKAGEWYANMAIPVNKMNTILSNKNVRDLIVEARGKKFYDTLITHLEEQGLNPPSKKIKRTDIEDTFGVVLDNWVSAAIGLSPSVPIKQLLSVVNYSENMPFLKWQSEFIKNMEHPVDTWKEMMKIPYLKTRIGTGYSEALQYVMAAEEGSPKAATAMQNVRKWMTSGTRYGDIAAIVFGGKPYLDYLVNDKKMSYEDAVKLFLEDTLRSQQSPFSSTLSTWQNSKNVIKRSIFVFSNTPSQYMRKMFEANEAYRKGDIKFGQLSKIYAIYGVIGNLNYVIVGALMKALLSGTDWDEDILKSILVQFAISAVGGIPIVKDIAEGLGRTVAGLYVYDDVNPLVEGATKLIEIGGKLYNADEDTDKTKLLMEGIKYLTPFAGVSSRNIEKIYKATIGRNKTVGDAKEKKTTKALTEKAKPKKVIEDQITGTSEYYQKSRKNQVDYKEAEAAHKLKYAYSRAKSKAKDLSPAKAEQITKAIRDSKVNLGYTDYNYSDIQSALDRFNALIEIYTRE